MRYRNAVAFLALGAIWGSAFVAIKAGLASIPPVLFAALRYDIAGVLVLGYAAIVTDPLPESRRDLAAIAVGATLLIAGYHALLFVGELETTSATAAVVVSLSPVLTAGFARIALPEERLSTLGVLGLGLGFAGVVVIARPEPGRLLSSDVLGPVLVFGAALSFALGSVLTRWLDADLSIEAMEGWSMVGGALLMHLLSLVLGESPAAIEWTPSAVLSLGYLSLVASALGFLVYFDLLDRLGPVEINLVSYVAPVFAALTGFLFLGEIIDIATAGGFVVILLGFVLLKRDAIRETVGGRLEGET
ncbi:DMTdrug-metabolite transporter superfamily permease protein [Halorhabdus tiamatea SARL4B]|uniref:DMT superfamily drug/metabolite transporter n=1 Tax=Halorhabdus tiamatea SARL4B TaxID=1033806 RepID=F7PNI3_9EURY|nr:EamA family transporter [Halorhabdus tiamatea]ERJ06218.1 DMTdrug-metabolite transporter superfamily permease protein [Halorhabdus tiamatea SARL4B]CCQ33778.1 DMT superfamily drug/metabolite transporter [Halorhabdus tiamatea SARL4B]